MLNHVSVSPDDIIYVTISGDQDENSISQLVTSTLQTLHQIQEKHSKYIATVFIDMHEAGQFSVASRKVGAKALKTIPFRKVAFVGANRVVKHITSLVILAIGQGAKIKQFENSASALRWLKSQ